MGALHSIGFYHKFIYLTFAGNSIVNLSCMENMCAKTFKCAGKANADLLDWVEMESSWKTNNTERMNMTSDQYVPIT